MGVVRYSKRAKTDLLDIWLWIAKDSLNTADRVISDIEQKAEHLRDNAELGRARPDIAPKARSLVSERWLILYMLEGDGVQVVRVVDGARDLSNVF